LKDVCKKFGLVRPLTTLDFKTREKEEGAFYSDMALQLGAYRRGEAVLLDDGSEHPLPPTDGGVVVQLHPDGYHVRPVRTRDEEYAAFLQILGYARWSIEWGAKVVSVWSQGPAGREYTFPDLDVPGVEPVKPVKAPRKSTPAKAAPAVAGAPAKRTAAAAGTQRKTSTARAAKAQPALPEPPRPSTLDLMRQPHPNSPQKDWIPF
jgi:hypothetical protein